MISFLKCNHWTPSTHLNNTVVHPRKLWPVAAVAGRDLCVDSAGVFRVGIVACSLFALVFLSPEGPGNFRACIPPGIPTSQPRSLAALAFLPRLSQIALWGMHRYWRVSEEGLLSCWFGAQVFLLPGYEGCPMQMSFLQAARGGLARSWTVAFDL